MAACDSRLQLFAIINKRSCEINRKFTFVLILLDLGMKGDKKCCVLMDMPPFLEQNSYDIIVKHMLECVETVTEKIFKTQSKKK